MAGFLCLAALPAPLVEEIALASETDIALPVVAVSDPWAAIDGRADAPAGSPQLPNLLDGYAFRPPWQVAGVDYPVGIQPGTTLQDPATISMAGVSVNTSTRRVTVTGDNVVLEAYDFALGGYQVIMASSASNLTLRNSRWHMSSAISSTNEAIFGQLGCSGLTVEYCEIDGGWAEGGMSSVATIRYDGAGLTIEYVWFKNIGADWIILSAGGSDPGPGDFILRFCLHDNGSDAWNYPVGAHPDGIQMPGGSWQTMLVDFVVYWQSGPRVEGPTPWSFVGGEDVTITHSVTLATGTNAVSNMHWGPESFENSGTINTNYYDMDGVLSGWIHGSSIDPAATFFDNIDMNSGADLSP